MDQKLESEDPNLHVVSHFIFIKINEQNKVNRVLMFFSRETSLSKNKEDSDKPQQNLSLLRGSAVETHSDD